MPAATGVDNLLARRISGNQHVNNRKRLHMQFANYRMTFIRHLVVFVILLSAVAAVQGCSHMVPATAGNPAAGGAAERIDDLTRALLALDSGVSEKEARGVAQSAFAQVAVLRRRYDIVRPPQLHNLLVKVGWKQRGLCYHWTEDLLRHLQALDLRHLHLQRVVAYRGSDLHEHHSVIVTTRKSPFSEGIVLDGWRHSGVLYWGPVGEDRYPWEPLSKSN